MPPKGATPVEMMLSLMATMPCSNPSVGASDAAINQVRVDAIGSRKLRSSGLFVETPRPLRVYLEYGAAPMTRSGIGATYLFTLASAKVGKPPD